jgi:hypothetical protein
VIEIVIDLLTVAQLLELPLLQHNRSKADMDGRSSAEIP